MVYQKYNEVSLSEVGFTHIGTLGKHDKLMKSINKTTYAADSNEVQTLANLLAN